jgi:putative ABC transport system permease protein
MIASYFRVAFRQLVTGKLYTAINVIGLAVALACAILMLLLMRHETTFDRRWADGERIYRISADYDPTAGQDGFHPAPNVQSAAAFLKEDFRDEIEQVGRLGASRVTVRARDAVFAEDAFRYADASFFDIFKVEWLAGDAQRALAAPASAVLTKSAAERYFGSEAAVGQTLLVDNQWPITVTGVIADFPDDTHLSGSVFASFDVGLKLNGFDYEGNWSYWGFHTYARLRPGARIDAIEPRLRDFVARHKRRGDGVSTMTATPIGAIHLHGRVAELRPSGSLVSVATFSAVAVCILFIACVNFTNLATARAARRAREVGVRKALGAARWELVAQFLGEAQVYAGIALLLALALVELALPALGAFLEMSLALEYKNDPVAVLGLLALAPLVGLLAGGYPALYLSSFEPARILRGERTAGRAGSALRSTLVVGQFAVSIALLIVTAVIYQQTHFARNLERGFEAEQVIVLTGSPTEGIGPGWPALQDRLRQLPEVTHVIAGSLRPMSAFGGRLVRAEGGDPAGRQIPTWGVDYGFFETYGIEVLAGRTFDEQRGTDRFDVPPSWPDTPHTTGAYVLNELAARELGWTPEEAIGKWFEVDFSSDFRFSVRGPIVGVVANTYVQSVRQPLPPLVYHTAVGPWGADPRPYLKDASIRVTGKQLEATLAQIDDAWADLVPHLPISRRFLDDSFDALYRAEQREASVFAAFSLLSIAITCLGLFGLAAFTTERRTKEIGIRKVMGGSVWDVLRLLTAEFSKLVVVANLIAWPAAYLLMSRWLAGFAYRIDMSPAVFVGSAVAAFAIAWLTVAAIAARAAGAKPIHALRYE